jgi:UDP-GlcNAc:undecaprenyl-phosphate/decaprenyl-phosphate GlcNAc-1-phosphate transferase
MTSILTSFLLSFLACILLLPFIIRYAKRRNLYDEPGRRRIHKRITPSMGGIGIFFGLMISLTISAETTQRLYYFELVAILVIPFILGLLDDLIQLSPKTKLLTQCLTAVFIFYVLDARIASFYGLLPLKEFSNIVSLPITLFAVILITNSYNLIDGIDGLAASVAAIILCFYCVWFYLADVPYLSVVAAAGAGGTVAFLVRNWAPAQIFMGDTGSLVLGTLMATLTFNFLDINSALPEPSPVRFESGLGTMLAILVVPFTDTFRVIIIRLSNRVSPFRADKRHIHHVLVRLGNSHRIAVITICAVQLGFIGLALICREGADALVIGVIVISATICCVALDRLMVPAFYKQKSKMR